MFDAIIKELATRFGLGDKAPMMLQLLLGTMTNKDTGGLVGFFDKFKNAGLGSIAQSWLGGNASTAQAISTSQVEQVLGGQGGLLGILTSKLGISGQTASSAMSFLLPLVIGKLSPNGSLPNSLPQEVMSFIGNPRSGVASAAPVAARPARGGLMKWLPWLALAAVALLLLNYCRKQPTVVEAPVAVVEAPAAVIETPQAVTVPADTSVIEEVIPVGAGALAGMVAGVPSLKVYFDTGKADIAPEFSERALPLVEYAKANANAKLVVSGFNDPTGDAAANEELSKNRAMAVAAALKAAGVSESSIVLEKPAVATGTGDTNAESRRVEVTVRN